MLSASRKNGNRTNPARMAFTMAKPYLLKLGGTKKGTMPFEIRLLSWGGKGGKEIEE